MKPGRILVSAALCIFAAHSTSTPLEGDDGRFISTQPSSTDFSTDKDKFDGTFVTGPSKLDGRSKAKFLVGAPRRSNFALFSQIEEKALWELRESELQKQNKLKELQPISKPFRKSRLKVRWPRILIKGDFVCVPQTPFANSPDWQDHLTCWNKETRHVK